MCVGRAGLHRGSAGAAGRGQWQARHAAEGATGLLRPGHDGEGSGARGNIYTLILPTNYSHSFVCLLLAVQELIFIIIMIVSKNLYLIINI